MSEVHAATVLLQWAAGGLAFGWLTTRRREVGPGYGWLLRSTYAAMLVLAGATGAAAGFRPVRDIAALAAAGVALAVLAVAFRRRGAPAGLRADSERRRARVAAMLTRRPGEPAQPAAPTPPGSPAASPTSTASEEPTPPGSPVDPEVSANPPAPKAAGQPTAPARRGEAVGPAPSAASAGPPVQPVPSAASAAGARPAVAEFPPVLDLVAPLVALVGVVAGGVAAGGPVALSVARVVVGALFFGAVSDAMLLGHWYLVQPGLRRAPLTQLVRWSMGLWVAETAVLLWPTGVVSILTGAIDDSFGGLLGWYWVACAAGSVVLLIATESALRIRRYAAVMAATGLLYLAIMTAFGMDLIARVSLRPGGL